MEVTHFFKEVLVIDSNAQLRLMQLSAGYDSLIAPWVWAVEDSRRRTLQLLEGIKQVTLDWQAPEGGNSIGTLLYHIAAIELSYLYEDIRGLGWQPELAALLPYELRDEQGQLTVVCGETLDTHMQRLAASRALLLDTLRGMSAVDWQRPREVEEYSISPAWAIHHLMQHEAEHRGEIGLLRQRAALR
jgi:uncharacterized damage-inducible protein DinB